MAPRASDCAASLTITVAGTPAAGEVQPIQQRREPAVLGDPLGDDVGHGGVVREVGSTYSASVSHAASTASMPDGTAAVAEVTLAR